MITDLPSRGFDEVELIAQQNQAVRLVDQPKGQVQAGENALDISACPFDGVRYRPHGPRFGQAWREHRDFGSDNLFIGTRWQE
jgi:hypothetical protein